MIVPVGSAETPMIAFSIKDRVLIGLIGPPIGPIGPIGGPIRPARGGVALSPVIEPHGCLTKLKGWWYYRHKKEALCFARSTAGRKRTSSAIPVFFTVDVSEARRKDDNAEDEVRS